MASKDLLKTIERVNPELKGDLADQTEIVNTVLNDEKKGVENVNDAEKLDELTDKNVEAIAETIKTNKDVQDALTKDIHDKYEKYGGVEGALTIINNPDLTKTPRFLKKLMRKYLPNVILYLKKKNPDFVNPFKTLLEKINDNLIKTKPKRFEGFRTKLQEMKERAITKYQETKKKFTWVRSGGAKRGRIRKQQFNKTKKYIKGGNDGTEYALLLAWIALLVTCCSFGLPCILCGPLLLVTFCCIVPDVCSSIATILSSGLNVFTGFSYSSRKERDTGVSHYSRKEREEKEKKKEKEEKEDENEKEKKKEKEEKEKEEKEKEKEKEKEEKEKEKEKEEKEKEEKEEKEDENEKENEKEKKEEKITPLYTILGLQPGATNDEIKNAEDKLKTKYVHATDFKNAIHIAKTVLVSEERLIDDKSIEEINKQIEIKEKYEKVLTQIYNFFGLPLDATNEELTNAYKFLIQKHEPKLNIELSVAHANLKNKYLIKDLANPAFENLLKELINIRTDLLYKFLELPRNASMQDIENKVVLELQKIDDESQSELREIIETSDTPPKYRQIKAIFLLYLLFKNSLKDIDTPGSKTRKVYEDYLKLKKQIDESNDSKKGGKRKNQSNDSKKGGKRKNQSNDSKRKNKRTKTKRNNK